MENPNTMTAEQVHAYIAAKYPQAMASPLAQLFGAAAAKDEADRAIDQAQITARQAAVK